jgi:hypothetical protein
VRDNVSALDAGRHRSPDVEYLEGGELIYDDARAGAPAARPSTTWRDLLSLRVRHFGRSPCGDVPVRDRAPRPRAFVVLARRHTAHARWAPAV